MTDEGTVFHLLIDHSHAFKITQQIIFQVIQAILYARRVSEGNLDS
jgi:hypothetical protein